MNENDPDDAMRTLTVLFVIDGLGTGGAERSLAEVLPVLSRFGVRPLVVCLHRRSEGVQAEIVDRFDVRFLERASTVGLTRSLRRVIEAERPDVVHSTIFAANMAARLAAIGGPPVVSTLVNTPYAAARLQDPRIKRSRLGIVRHLDGWSARHLTTHFQAITEAVADHAVDRLGIARDRITVVERGRDPERLGRASRERRIRARRMLGLDEAAEVLVTLGRQEFQKGQRFLIGAVALLLERRPNLVALLAGRRGESTEELTAQAQRAGLGDRVRFLGHRDDAPELLAAADLYVFPSLWEGLGGSLIEAMALELPIVASRIPAITEVVEDRRNGILVEPGSAPALASAVEELLSDPTLARSFGARGRTIFEERFTLERSVSRLVDLYRRVTKDAASEAEPRTRAMLRGGSRS